MASHVHHPRLEGADFDALLAEHGWSLEAELIAGEAVVIPPDGPAASITQGELHVALRAWQQQTGDRGRVMQSVFVKVGVDSRLGPDVAWWPDAPATPLPEGQMVVVPDWVAEVLSPSTRANDLGPKREAYLAAGVRELWFVDPVARSVTIVAGDGAERVAEERCESLVLPGFSVATAALFPY